MGVKKTLEQRKAEALALLNKDLAEFEHLPSWIIRVRITVLVYEIDQEKQRTFEGLLRGSDDGGQFVILANSVADTNIVIKLRKSKIIRYWRPYLKRST